MTKSKTSKIAAKDDTQTILAAMAAANPMATKAWLDIVSESSRFLTDRLTQDLETQKALLACKSPGEVIEVQSMFFQKALSDYTEEATRLFSMMADATGDTVEEATKPRTSKYDDIPV